MKILVIGGTGNVGSEVVKELTKRHADVRMLVRKPEEKTTAAVETVVGDLLDPVSIEKASIWSKALGQEIKYAGENLDSFEEQLRKQAPSRAAFDIRMMFQRYLERGFVAEDGDAATLAKPLGHAPRAYEDFAREAVGAWQKPADSRAAA